MKTIVNTSATVKIILDYNTCFYSNTNSECTPVSKKLVPNKINKLHQAQTSFMYAMTYVIAFKVNVLVSNGRNVAVAFFFCAKLVTNIFLVLMARMSERFASLISWTG